MRQPRGEACYCVIAESGLVRDLFFNSAVPCGTGSSGHTRSGTPRERPANRPAHSRAASQLGAVKDQETGNDNYVERNQRPK